MKVKEFIVKADQIIHKAANLSQVEKDLVTTKTLSGRFSAQKLRSTFSELMALDAENDAIRTEIVKKQSKLFKYALLSGIIGAILTFSFFFIGGLAFFIFYIPSRKLKKRHIELTKIDITNSFKESLLPIVSVISQDIAQDEKLKIDFSGRYAMSSEFHVNKIAREGRYGKEINTYHFPWLSIQTVLVDGTILNFNCSKHIQDVHVAKRSRSGKYKTKRKYKVKNIFNLRLDLPKDKYVLTGRKTANAVSSEVGDKIILKSKSVHKGTDIYASMKAQEMIKTILDTFALTKKIAA